MNRIAYLSNEVMAMMQAEGPCHHPNAEAGFDLLGKGSLVSDTARHFCCSENGLYRALYSSSTLSQGLRSSTVCGSPPGIFNQK